MDEFGLIARYFAPIASVEAGAFGLGDDAAVLDLTPGARLVCATDALVAGVHFLADDPPADIARKLVRVNLSDMAAMGARPRAVLLALVLPRGTNDAWLAGFAEGLADDCRTYAVPLVGGDTVASDGPLTLALTVIGETGTDGAVLRRAGARPGDDIYVSGSIGDAALGLRLLTGRLTGLDPAVSDPLIARYRRPEPQLALGRGLVGVASAGLDVSDGLLADLGHICEQSATAAQITAAAVPFSPATRQVLTLHPELFGPLLGGGDDYELLFTAPPSAREAVAAISTAACIGCARIGVMVAVTEKVTEVAVEVTDAGTLRLDLGEKGYRHF